jgi:hypothetical protein
MCPELSASKTEKLILTTGSESGTYYPLGKAIAGVMRNYDLEVEVIPSTGSFHNLKRISSDSADIAFVQNDILYRDYKENCLKNIDYDCRPVLSLYTETVQIVYRGNLSLKKITDLRNKRISLGQVGSGTVCNSRAILESAGLTLCDIRPLYLSFEESVDSLREDAIDVAFFTAGLPTLAIAQLDSLKKIKILSFDSPTLQRTLENCPYFVQTFIPSSTYKNFHKEVATVGVKALLVANKNVETVKIRNVVETIFAEKDYLIQKHPKAREIKLFSALEGTADLPLHLGAKAYYSAQGLFFKRKVYDTTTQNLPFIILVFLISIGFWKRRDIWRLCAKHDLILAGLLLFSIWVVCSSIIYFAEHRFNESFDTLPASLHSILVYLFSGFEDRIPITGLGKVMATITLVLGVGVAGLYTASLTTLLVNRKLKGGKMTSAEKRGHVIICNWNEKGEHVIKELRSKDLPEIRPVLIIAKSTELSEYFKEPPKKVYWEDKDPTDFEVLKQERIDQAHSVIVLIDNSLKEHPDNKSAVIIRLIKNLCESSKKKSGPNICVEVADEKNKDTLKRFGAHEFVSASYSVERLLAQSAISPGITKFFDNLLTVTPNSNEVCMIKCPKNFESHSFEEVAHALAQLRDTDNPVILCGVKTNNQLIINPQKDKFDKFKPGDELLVIVWTATKLSQINKIKL